MKYLKELKDSGEPITYGKREAVGFSYPDGIPDVYFDIRDIHCELELKAPKGKASAIQLKWELIFKKQGTPYLRSNDFAEIVKFIQSNLK